MTAFHLAHISDPHLPPPDAPPERGDLLSKRLLSRFAWQRKHRRHSTAVLDAVVADICGRSPDHLAITGDLTNFSSPSEIEQARVWLQCLGNPADVTVSPGNHDALVAHGQLDFTPWRPWLGDGSHPEFPHVRVRGPVAILNLSSAVPTRLHLAQGTLGPAQIARAETLLRELGASRLFRVVLLHHPPVEGVVAWRKSLTDAGSLRATLKRAGAELVLHGHAHEALLNVVPGPASDIPVIGVPSASTPAARLDDQAARWNRIEILRDGAAFRTRITARSVTASLSVATMGQFELA